MPTYPMIHRQVDVYKGSFWVCLTKDSFQTLASPYWHIFTCIWMPGTAYIHYLPQAWYQQNQPLVTSCWHSKVPSADSNTEYLPCVGYKQNMPWVTS